MPTRSAISACVRSRSKRRCRISRSRAGSASSVPAQALAELDARVAELLVGERLAVAPVVVAVRPGARGVQRGRLVGGRGLHRLEHVLDRQPERRRHVPRTRGAAELARQRRHRVADLERELLGGARHSHRPALVAEVPLELAEHRRHGVLGEAAAALDVVAVDGLQQPHAGDLDEVVVELAAMAVATRELPCERHEAQHELLARLQVPLHVIPAQQLQVSLVPLLRALRGPRQRSHHGYGHAVPPPLAVSYSRISPF